MEISQYQLMQNDSFPLTRLDRRSPVLICDIHMFPRPEPRHFYKVLPHTHAPVFSSAPNAPNSPLTVH